MVQALDLGHGTWSGRRRSPTRNAARRGSVTGATRPARVVSMSRPGNCWDNAPMESFFATLKTERVDHIDFDTREQMRRDLFDFIEVFYNRKRRHSALGYLSPADFETIQAQPTRVLTNQKPWLATRFRRTMRVGSLGNADSLQT